MGAWGRPSSSLSPLLVPAAGRSSSDIAMARAAREGSCAKVDESWRVARRHGQRKRDDELDLGFARVASAGASGGFRTFSGGVLTRERPKSRSRALDFHRHSVFSCSLACRNRSLEAARRSAPTRRSPRSHRQLSSLASAQATLVARRRHGVRRLHSGARDLLAGPGSLAQVNPKVRCRILLAVCDGRAKLSPRCFFGLVTC